MTLSGVIKIIAGLAIVAGFAGALIWWKLSEPPEPPETPSVAPADQSVSPLLKSLVITPEAYVCSNGSCTAAPAPPQNTEPVTDGQWWYFYEGESLSATSPSPTPKNTGRAQGQEKKYLRRKNTQSQKIETIMESTPLTSPRGLYMSPNGKHVAFWLDNIDKPTEELTELWVYDVDDGGIRLLAEKLYRPDVRSDVFWNTQATFLWFVADTGEQKLTHDVLELIIVNADSPGKRAAFADVPWADLLEDISAAAIDLSQQADRLTYTTTNFLGTPILVLQTAHQKQRTNLRGDVKYTQWLEDASLLYALQDDRGFTFWRVREGVHRLVARRNGQLVSARSDSAGENIVFANRGQNSVYLSSLNITTGRIRQEGDVRNKQVATIVWVEPAGSAGAAEQTGITSELQDAEIAAFIEENFADITGDKNGRPLRLIATEEVNAVFLDYRDSKQAEHRLLVKIHDAVNTEWSIKARYVPVNREWKKVQGGGLADPKPTRLYEWEGSLKQWILKSSL